VTVIEGLVGAVILAVLVLYAVLGGADFGGGVWDLLASGPRRDAQRDAVARAIGPIWEVNHIWLILAVVLLFVCFPTVYAELSIALHLPFTLLLLGIVLRGSAFVFRAYDHAPGAERWWGRVFAGASTMSPLFLGVSVGAIASGRASHGTPDPWAAWWAPMPLAVGGFALCLVVFLAATYLCAATDGDLREDFRARALIAWAVAGGAAWGVLALAPGGAPFVWARVADQPLAPLALGAVVVASVAPAAALWRRRWRVARAAAVIHVAAVVASWGGAQFPYLIPPTLTVHDAAAPSGVLTTTVVVLVGGLFVLVPAYVWLLRTFRASSLGG
jgi:cytochrome d ubiquinol oxidase subunit II